MHGSRKFSQRGSNFDNIVFFCFVFLDERREDPSSTKSGPSSDCQRNAILLVGRWWPNIECWPGSFVIFQRIQTSIAKKPYIFLIFQGGGGPEPLSPPLDWRLKLYKVERKANMLKCCLRRHITQRIDLSAMAHHNWKMGFVLIRSMHYSKHLHLKVTIEEQP